MSLLRAYIGRDNVQRLELRQDGELVAENAVTRAQFRFGPFCIDTDEVADPIELTDSATVVEMQLGRVEGASPGLLEGHLTVYDAVHPEGIGWQSFMVLVERWPACA